MARVAIRCMTTQKLTVQGYEAQEAYMLECLRLVHEFGALRRIALAYAMFPTRTPIGAAGAAKLVLKNALSLGYLECARRVNSWRHYALTIRGARVLHEADDSYRVRSTQKSLTVQRYKHREWANIITFASRHRGMHSVSEVQLLGAAHNEILTYIGHLPDALSFYVDADGEHRVAWHEVDSSRRSSADRRRLAHLIRTLIEKRYLTHEKKPHTIHLVMHCGDAQIRREVHSLIEAELSLVSAEVNTNDSAIAAAVGKGEAERYFLVDINTLPKKIEEVWSSSLPWPDAPGQVSGKFDMFLTPVGQSRLAGA